MMSVQVRSRDKFAIGAVLAILSLVAWASTVSQSQAMGASVPMPDMMDPAFSPM